MHVEVIGAAPAVLRAFYASLFDWEVEPGAPVAAEVSAAGEYAFVGRATTDDGTGVPGGIGGGPGYAPHAIFYVGVADVDEALRTAERLGGTRVMGPARNDAGGVVVGHFRDPEGNLVGVAGPA